MYDGSLYWDESITKNMAMKDVSPQKTVFTYSETEESLYLVLRRAAQDSPNKTAIVDNYSRSFTYLDLLGKVDAFSSHLKYIRDVKYQSHVALMFYNSIEFCVAFLALSKLGAVAIPLPTKYTKQEVSSLIDKSDVEFIICDEAFFDWFVPYETKNVSIIRSSGIEQGYGFAYIEDAFLPQTKPEGGYQDTAIIMFTSGTTSQSKGVMIKNYNMMHAIVSYQRILGITGEDISIIPIPIYHITGIVALLGLFLYVQGTLYLLKFFDAGRVLDCVKQNGITFIHASPTIFSKLLELSPSYPSLPSLRSFACGSSNMPKEKLNEIHRWLPHTVFHTVYGLTETTSPATIYPGDAGTGMHIGSSGRPIPGLCFKILDEKGEELSHEKVGEIHIKGSVVLDAYYNTKTEALSDGWLDTGDLGYFTADGYLYVVDRKKDMINRGGEKIWSFDVENELYHIKGIVEAAVVGIPDEIYGEVAAAAVRFAPGIHYTEKELQRLLRTRLAKYMIPAKIIEVPEIPLTRNSKIDKIAVRKLFTN
jgi:fatty-acyl-CoA synthase/long-chain acyl-CoA synthetase